MTKSPLYALVLVALFAASSAYAQIGSGAAPASREKPKQILKGSADDSSQGSGDEQRGSDVSSTGLHVNPSAMKAVGQPSAPASGLGVAAPNASKGPQGNEQFKKELHDARTLDAVNNAKNQVDKTSTGIGAPKQDENLHKQGAKYVKDKKDAETAKKAAEEKEKKKKSCLSGCDLTFKTSSAKFSGMCNSGPSAICKPEIYAQYQKIKANYETCKQNCSK